MRACLLGLLLGAALASGCALKLPPTSRARVVSDSTAVAPPSDSTPRVTDAQVPAETALRDNETDTLAGAPPPARGGPEAAPTSRDSIVRLPVQVRVPRGYMACGCLNGEAFIGTRLGGNGQRLDFTVPRDSLKFEVAKLPFYLFQLEGENTEDVRAEAEARCGQQNPGARYQMVVERDAGRINPGGMFALAIILMSVLIQGWHP